jgi:hypothetical protein
MKRKFKMMMTFEEWKEKYNPITEPATGYVRMFETYGEELKLISLVHENYIWTLVDDGEEDEDGYAVQYLVAGMHLANRLYYVVTNKCWERRDLTAEW